MYQNISCRHIRINLLQHHRNILFFPRRDRYLQSSSDFYRYILKITDKLCSLKFCSVLLNLSNRRAYRFVWYSYRVPFCIFAYDGPNKSLRPDIFHNKGHRRSNTEDRRPVCGRLQNTCNIPCTDWKTPFRPCSSHSPRTSCRHSFSRTGSQTHSPCRTLPAPCHTRLCTPSRCCSAYSPPDIPSGSNSPCSRCCTSRITDSSPNYSSPRTRTYTISSLLSSCNPYNCSPLRSFLSPLRNTSLLIRIRLRQSHKRLRSSPACKTRHSIANNTRVPDSPSNYNCRILPTANTASCITDYPRTPSSSSSLFPSLPETD